MLFDWNAVAAPGQVQDVQPCAPLTLTGDERISGLTKSGSTLALHMYIQASEGLYTEQAYATSVVLLALVLLINLGSSRIAKMMMKGRE